MARKSQTELESLEHSRVALENAKANLQIYALLEEVGYGNDKLDEGKALLEAATEAYNANIREDQETAISKNQLNEKLDELESLYRSHRRRAKVLFANDNNMMIKLDVHHVIPDSYLALMQTMKLFYAEALSNTQVSEALQSLKVSAEELNKTSAMVAEVEELRLNYLNERGESQGATKTKDQALSNLDKWMRSFYAVAGIVLEGNPQLMESLYKSVKS